MYKQTQKAVSESFYVVLPWHWTYVHIRH